MKTDVDACLNEVADWFIKNRRQITPKDIDPILRRHCESEDEVKKFISFLETESGQLRFKILLREKKGTQESPGQHVNPKPIPPGTKLLTWQEFSSLQSFPLIERAVTYPHDYRRKCSPVTPDGYVSVDAIYNMSAWASWKSSSLGEGERAIADAIQELNLYSLMKLNQGRRMNQPALFPEAGYFLQR